MSNYYGNMSNGMENNDDDEDDWLETPNQGCSTDPLVDQEYQRLATRYSDAGYREGITEGKLSTLQIGFDQAFQASVKPSRQIGILRGKAAALLHYLNSPSRSLLLSTSTSDPNGHSGEREKAIEELQDLMRDLGKVRRVDVLPIDKERVEHDKEHEAEEGGGYELDQNHQRDMESLEDSLAGISGNGGGGDLREQELLNHLESRLNRLMAMVKA